MRQERFEIIDIDKNQVFIIANNKKVIVTDWDYCYKLVPHEGMAEPIIAQLINCGKCHFVYGDDEYLVFNNKTFREYVNTICDGDMTQITKFLKENGVEEHIK